MYATAARSHVHSLRLRFALRAGRSRLVSRLRFGASARSADLQRHDTPLSLATRGVEYVAEAGTVTRVVSQSFAGLADRPELVEMEVRASWTPLGPDVGAHLLAWADLLCTIAGLPPLPEGVVALPGPRR